MAIAYSNIQLLKKQIDFFFLSKYTPFMCI